MPDYTTEEKLALTEQMLAITQRELDQARDLAREMMGHLSCKCIQRRLPHGHWLFDREKQGD